MNAATLAHYTAMLSEATDERTSMNFDADIAAVLTGEPVATSGACNSLLEHLANSADFPNLVRTALSCSADVTGARFKALLMQVMLDDAEMIARRDLAAA